MPVAKGPRVTARSAVLIGITGVMIALVFGAGLVLLADRNSDVEINLGDSDFDAGGIERISAEIDDRGPILYSDVAGRSRDLILQHLGDDPEAGWFAFDARPPGESRDCFFEWNDDQQYFELTTVADNVTCRTVTMDERGNLDDGTVILSYPIAIDERNRLRVDINYQSNEDG